LYFKHLQPYADRAPSPQDEELDRSDSEKERLVVMVLGAWSCVAKGIRCAGKTWCVWKGSRLIWGVELKRLLEAWVSPPRLVGKRHVHRLLQNASERLPRSAFVV